MDKRAILAAVLSMVVLIGYQYFFINPQMEARRQAQEEAARKQAAEAKKEPAQKETPARAEGSKREPAPPPIAAPATPLGAKAKEIVVETGVARIVLTTLGAGIKELILTQYKDADGRPLNLAAQPPAKEGRASASRPMRPLYLGSGGFGDKADQAVYSVNEEQLTLTPEEPEGTLEFVHTGRMGRPSASRSASDMGRTPWMSPSAGTAGGSPITSPFSGGRGS